MRKRKTGSARRGIGFPLIIGAIAVYYVIRQSQAKRVAALTSGYENSPARFSAH